MPELSLEALEKRREALETRIILACKACQRPRESVTLIWVSKFHPITSVENAIQLGAKEFGENRVQEAIEKFSTPRAGIHCHIIGPIQANKLRKAASVADSIHSIASLDAIHKLESICAETGKILDILIQVNTSEEDTKSGITMSETESFLLSLPEAPHLRYRGLMTIGKNTGRAEDSRAGFCFLREMRDKMHASGGLFENFSELSMGMTEDLEVAIEEGATLIRVGTALFGERARLI
jgi:PLP dependent protein